MLNGVLRIMERTKCFILSTQQQLQDIFIQKWMSDISITSDTNLYKYIKQEFGNCQYIQSLPLLNVFYHFVHEAIICQ